MISKAVHRFQSLITSLFLLTILSLGLIPGPKLLGVWESYYFYHTFGALKAPIQFRISPRANIGDPGHGLIEISRNIIEWFGLNLRLETFRIPAIIYGAISIILFFIIARRYFGNWAALGATALLAANPMFHQQQHTMTVLIISGMGFLFFVERLQALEFRYGSMVAWSGLSVAAALVALHYGVGRIYAVIFLGFWLAKVSVILCRKPGGSKVFRSIMYKGFIAVIILVGLLAILDWRNLISLLRADRFFLPSTGEIAVISGIYSNISTDFFTTLCFNGKIIFESIFTYGGDYHSIFPTYRAADYRFPLIASAVLPFVLGGLVICLARIRQRTVLLATPWLSIFVLLLVCTIPLLFSSVFINHQSLPNGLMGTLSNHRLYYMIFPLYLLVAVFLNWVLEDSRIRRFAAAPLAAAVILVFAWSVYGLVKENLRFEAQLATIDPSLSGHLGQLQWRDGTANLDRSDVNASHFQQHAQYYRAALEITKLVHEIGEIDQPLLIQADINLFTESPLKPYTLGYINEFNYHDPYLALYLADSGTDAAWLLMLNKDCAPKQLGFTRPREYSAPMALHDDTGLGYQNPQEIVGIVQYFGPSAIPAAILATTPEEIEAARRWFDVRGLHYRTITLQSIKPIQQFSKRNLVYDQLSWGVNYG
jgi:hypothetical protein